MILKIIAFGIAKDIIGQQTLKLELDDSAKIVDLKKELERQYPKFSKLASLSFAVNESYQEDTFELFNEAEVVIIPPVAGG